MSLTHYKRKRNFKRTTEPKAELRPKGGTLFVIQKHRASHLHYDFRLELDGVLKSWAVPKGPSLDPSVKRLAMQVEDHPVAYGDFEGMIPEGEYGGGTVMLWDRGTWEPIGDPHDGYRNGRLKFKLRGEKLHGNWMLVHSGARSQNDRDQRRWLLFKERDDDAQSTDDGDVVEESPLSVATGRDLDDIASDRDRVWGSNNSAARKSPKTKALSPKAKAFAEAKANLSKSSKEQPSPKPAGAKLTAARQPEELEGVRFTHPDKLMFSDEGITKFDLAQYYLAAAGWMLPHVVDRPLVLVRCPDGFDKDCFYQKHPRVGTPSVLRTVEIRESKKAEDYVIVDNAAGLVGLVQIGALEIHAWGCRAEKLEQPDRLIFDLDPDPTVPWETVVDAARRVRQFIQELGLETFVKTTGGKGLHLVAPIDRRHDWDDVKAFCKQAADAIVAADPKAYTANMAKKKRPDKIFVDYLRNGRGATAIVPYSTRARPGAPVAVPLSWDELSPKIQSDQFTMASVLERLSKLKRDPWAEMTTLRQSLAGPIKKLSKLVG